MDLRPPDAVIRRLRNTIARGDTADQRRSADVVQPGSRSIDAVREAILGFIAARNPGLPPGAIVGETSLVTSDALDSIGILDLMMHLGERYGVEIDEEAFALDNFESVDTLARFIDDRRTAA